MKPYHWYAILAGICVLITSWLLGFDFNSRGVGAFITWIVFVYAVWTPLFLKPGEK